VQRKDTPTAILVRQVLGAIAQFDKATLVAKLKAPATANVRALASVAVAGRTWRRPRGRRPGAATPAPKAEGRPALTVRDRHRA
jgi:hypothetical protein